MEEDNVGRTMLEEVTGAFMMPWPRKPTAKVKGAAKGVSKGAKSTPGTPKSMTRSKHHVSRGSFNKKQNAGGNWF